MRALPQHTGSWLTLTALAAAIVAVLIPLGTYAVTLALFGLVHVAVELRYVDRRFSGRVPWRLGTALVWILGVIVLLRLLQLGGVLERVVALRWELVLVALLVGVALPVLLRAGIGHAMLGGLLLGLIVFGAFRAPLLTIVIFAIAHNLTPMGFLADALEGKERRWAMALGTVLFVVVPVLIASGVVADWLGGARHADWPLPDAGALDVNLGVFVPGPLLGHARALDFFSAAVYLQCMHYAVVIFVLPRLAPARETRRTRLPWPQPRLFGWALMALSAVSFLAFVWAFRDIRIVYGLFALVHAWIEIPVLLLALALRPTG